jgi:hypothetical protein
MEEMRDRRHLLLIPIAALLAATPLFLKGCSCGDDFSFHLLNWLEVGSQWRQGVLLPHWSFTAAWNTGEPRFVFYPPLSWVTGALSGLILPWSLVPNIYIWLALTTCGFTMYRLARAWASEGSALIAASFYMIHPYMLYTFYERSAYSELLAAAWIPLVLLALLRPRITISSIALPVALLWLTNDPAAVMGCYLLALLSAVRIAWIYNENKSFRESVREALRITIGVCLGLGLAGFYLVPAIVEQRWVRIRMYEIEGTRIQDNFLFGNFGGPSHQAILHRASVCSLALLALIAMFAVVALYRNFRDTRTSERMSRVFVITTLLATALVLGFFLTSSSYFFWRHIPELKYLQFPWRFDALLGTISAALLALTLGRTRMRPAAAIILVIPLVFSFVGDSIFRQVCQHGKDVPDLVASFHSGQVSYPDEYNPSGSDPEKIGHDNPDTWIAEAANAAPPANTPIEHPVRLSDRLHFYVLSSGDAFFIINLREYPAWKIVVNGKADTNRPHRADGLIVVPVRKGLSKIDLAYALMPDAVFGWVLTVISAMAIFWARRRDTAKRHVMETAPDVV